MTWSPDYISMITNPVSATCSSYYSLACHSWFNSVFKTFLLNGRNCMLADYQKLSICMHGRSMIEILQNYALILRSLTNIVKFLSKSSSMASLHPGELCYGCFICRHCLVQVDQNNTDDMTVPKRSSRLWRNFSVCISPKASNISYLPPQLPSRSIFNEMLLC